MRGDKLLKETKELINEIEFIETENRRLSSLNEYLYMQIKTLEEIIRIKDTLIQSLKAIDK